MLSKIKHRLLLNQLETKDLVLTHFIYCSHKYQIPTREQMNVKKAQQIYI